MNTNCSFKQNRKKKKKKKETKQKEKKKKQKQQQMFRGGKSLDNRLDDLVGMFSKTTSNCKFYIDILVQQVCIICHIRYIWRYVEVTYFHHFSVKYLLQTSRPV